MVSLGMIFVAMSCVTIAPESVGVAFVFFSIAFVLIRYA